MCAVSCTLVQEQRRNATAAASRQAGPHASPPGRRSRTRDADARRPARSSCTASAALPHAPPPTRATEHELVEPLPLGRRPGTMPDQLVAQDAPHPAPAQPEALRRPFRARHRHGQHTPSAGRKRPPAPPRRGDPAPASRSKAARGSSGLTYWRSRRMRSRRRRSRGDARRSRPRSPRSRCTAPHRLLAGVLLPRGRTPSLCSSPLGAERMHSAAVEQRDAVAAREELRRLVAAATGEDRPELDGRPGRRRLGGLGRSRAHRRPRLGLPQLPDVGDAHAAPPSEDRPERLARSERRGCRARAGRPAPRSRGPTRA